MAFLIIAIIAAAGTSLTIRGMRATLESKQLGQAKNLVNQQIETMRGLPYFVSHTTSTARVDVLDQFYPTVSITAGAPTCTADAATWRLNKTAWSGFVSAAATRCPFEPSGAFYRVVDPPNTGDAHTTIVVATQFLELASGTGNASPVVAPPTGYSWDDTGLVNPFRDQIAAYAAAVYGSSGAARKITTSRTDIADRKAGPALVSAETNAAAVVIDGALATGVPLRLEIGTVIGNGDVTTMTRAAVEAVGASMQTDTSRVDGKTELVNSPGALVSSGMSSAQTFGTLSIGATHTSGVSATSTTADPGFGGPAVASAASGVFSLDQDRAEIDVTTANPIVMVDSGAIDPWTSSSCPAVTRSYDAASAGWMDSGVSSPFTLESCAMADSGTVKLFPTGDAPDGLIQVEASDVIARCSISGSTPAANASGAARIRWFDDSPDDDYSPWTTVTSTTDMSIFLGTPLANGRTIGHYVASWAAFRGVQQTQTTIDGRSASARVPGALSITTVPMRRLNPTTLDPDSVVKVSVGRATCSATDRR